MYIYINIYIYIISRYTVNVYCTAAFKFHATPVMARHRRQITVSILTPLTPRAHVSLIVLLLWITYKYSCRYFVVLRLAHFFTFCTRYKIQVHNSWKSGTLIPHIQPVVLATEETTVTQRWKSGTLIPHIQLIVLATEETTVTRRVSHRPIKCHSRSWSQRGTKVNGSHRGSDPLLRPTGIQIATKPLPGPTNREHRKLIGVKTMSLGTKYSFYCHSLECCQYFRM